MGNPNNTLISIKKLIKKELDEMKIHPRESYGDLVEKLVKEYKEKK